jgi:hypothetical protein
MEGREGERELAVVLTRKTKYNKLKAQKHSNLIRKVDRTKRTTCRSDYIKK